MKQNFTPYPIFIIAFVILGRIGSFAAKCIPFNNGYSCAKVRQALQIEQLQLGDIFIGPCKLSSTQTIDICYINKDGNLMNIHCNACTVQATESDPGSITKSTSASLMPSSFQTSFDEEPKVPATESDHGSSTKPSSATHLPSSFQTSFDDEPKQAIKMMTKNALINSFDGKITANDSTQMDSMSILTPDLKSPDPNDFDIVHNNEMNKLTQELDLEFNISCLTDEEVALLNKQLIRLGIQEKDEELSIHTKVSSANVVEMKKLANFANIEMKEMEELMNPRNEFLEQCLFNRKFCKLEKDVEATFQSQFGVCFSFNTNNATQHKTDNFAVQDGLKLLLSTNIEDSVFTTLSGGIKVLVHDYEEYPFLDSFGLLFSVGSDSTLHIDVNQISRIPLGIRKCNNEIIETYNYYGERRYSYEGCTRSFLQEKLYEMCGCGSLDFAAEDTQRSNFSVCPANDLCMSRMSHQAEEILKESPCNVECRKTYYKVETSFSTMRNDRTSTNIGLNASSSIRLEIRMRSLLIIAIRERAAMQAEDILWSFCQIIGLSLGISAIEVAALLTSAAQIIFLQLSKIVLWKRNLVDTEKQFESC